MSVATHHNWPYAIRRLVSPGVQQNALLISFILPSTPFFLFSSFEIPILQSCELLDLSSMSPFFFFFLISLLCLLQFWKISSSLSARLLTWSSAISVLCLSPLIEIFKCNHISHFQEWFLLLWLLPFTTSAGGYDRLSDPPEETNSGESEFSSLPWIISAYSRVKCSVSPLGPSLLWCVFSPNVLRSLRCCISFTNKGSSWLMSKRPGFSLQLYMVSSKWLILGMLDKPWAVHTWAGHTYQQDPLWFKGREPAGRPGRPLIAKAKTSKQLKGSFFLK